MVKLKTLKDLEEHTDLAEQSFSEELKQEAIKWIQSLQGNKEVWITQEGIDLDDSIKGSLISWIKHFFNITEEDLKPKQEASEKK